MMDRRDKTVILACLSAAGDAYSEAQRDGLDAHAAHKCAMEAIEELLNAPDCICSQTALYGFVVEAGCRLHDVKE